MCRSRRISRTASIRIWSPSGSSTYRSGCERRSTRGSPPSSSRRRTRARSRACRPRPARGRGTRAPAPRRAPREQPLRLALLRNAVEARQATSSRDLPRRRACRRSVDDPLREDGRQLAVGLGRPRARNSSSSRSIRSLGSPHAPRRLLGVDQRAGTCGRAGRRGSRAGSARARGRARGRARSPGRRATSRGSGRRRRRRRARAPARSPRSTSCARAAANSAASAQGAISSPREQQLADPLAELGPARLARGDDLPAVGRERLGEQLRLGRLAGAVEPFERDEHAAPRIRGGAGDRDRGRGLHRLARGRGAARARRRGASSLDDLSNGKRENVPEGARLVESPTSASRSTTSSTEAPEACFHLAAQADVRVSVERPDHDADVNVLGTIHVLEAARRHGTQVVFSSTGGAIYGECDGPAPRGGRAPAALARTASRSSPARSTWPAYNRLYGTRHVVAALRQRLRAAAGPARRGRRGRDLPRRLAAGESRRGSSATAGRRATTSTRATSRARRWPRSGRTAASSTSAPGSETSVRRALRALPARGGLGARGGARAARGSASSSAACSTPRARSGSSAGGPRSRSKRASASPGKRSISGRRRIGAPRRRIGRSARGARPSDIHLSHPWRTIAVVAAGIAALELLGLVVVARRAAGEAGGASRQAAASKARDAPSRSTEAQDAPIAAAASRAARLGHRAERERRLGRAAADGLARARARVHVGDVGNAPRGELRAQRRHVPRRPRAPRPTASLATSASGSISPLDGLRPSDLRARSSRSSSAASSNRLFGHGFP